MTDEEKLRFEAVFLYLEIARNRLKVKADVLPEKAGQALDVADLSSPSRRSRARRRPGARRADLGSAHALGSMRNSTLNARRGPGPTARVRRADLGSAHARGSMLRSSTLNEV